MDDDFNPTHGNGEDSTGGSSSSSNNNSNNGDEADDSNNIGLMQGATGIQLPEREDGRPQGRPSVAADDGQGSPARKRSRSSAAAQGGHRQSDAAGRSGSSASAATHVLPPPPRAAAEVASTRQVRTTVDDPIPPRYPIASSRQGSAFNVPSHPAPLHAAGYASNVGARFVDAPSALSYSDMAALLAYAREREAVLAREREVALHYALLNRAAVHHHHHHQFPDWAASLDPSALHRLLLLPASQQQHSQQPPPHLHPLDALISQSLRSQAQAQHAQLGYAEAPPRHPPPARPAPPLSSSLDPRGAATGAYQLLQAQQSFGLQRATLLASAAAASAPVPAAEPAATTTLLMPHDATRRTSWGSSGFASLTSEEQKEGLGRMWPGAARSSLSRLVDPPAPPPPPAGPRLPRPPAQAQSDPMSSTRPPPPKVELVSCRFHVRAIPVSLNTDAGSTSKFQALLREQMLYVEAVMVDVQASTQGRNRPIKEGQVGILCKHCRNIPPRNRPRGAMYFPHRLLSIYQSAQNMANHHFGAAIGCPNAPDEVNEALRIARLDKSIVYGGGQQYWARAAAESGLVETDDRGLAFGSGILRLFAAAPADASDAAAPPSSSSPASL